MDATLTADRLYEAFDLIPPFDFLALDEREALVSQARPRWYASGQSVGDPGDADPDALFLLVQGRVKYQPGDPASEIEYLEAPAYFRERAVFFDQPSAARYFAEGPVACFWIPGKDIRALTDTDATFKRAFATAFRNKHRLLADYEIFLNQLFAQADAGIIRLQDLLAVYKRLKPILHEKASQTEIDTSALAYALPRLPKNITSTLALVLADEFPKVYCAVEPAMRVASRKEGKRRAYELMPGKTIILLRDRMTDTTDVVTKLCIYAVEAEKIRVRLAGAPVAMRLAQAVVGGALEHQAASIETALPFPAETVAQLKKLFGAQFLQNLHEILNQRDDLYIHVEKTGHRARTASEAWLARIRSALAELIPPEEQGDLDVHIISSNTHSVNSCLSRWLHGQSEAILTWAEQNQVASDLHKATDRLYAGWPQWAAAHPDQAAERARVDREQGILVVQDPYSTGIEVSLIDANCLQAPLDPDLGAPVLSKRTLLVNIDYAYGQQAEIILHSLILLFGRRVRSISILGKAGAVVGQRGDLLLPTQLLLQSNDEPFPIPNRDLLQADLELGCPRALHEGTLLTVLGTVMQSRDMLEYYRRFWNVIGMEMEGAFYLREILRARSLRLIHENVALRFAYYTSDTPLEAEASLALGMSASEGIPPLYAITRAILRRILCPAAAGAAELSEMVRRYGRFKREN